MRRGYNLSGVRDGGRRASPQRSIGLRFRIPGESRGERLVCSERLRFIERIGGLNIRTASNLPPTQFRRGNRPTRTITPSFTFHTTHSRARFREIEKDLRWAAGGCASISYHRPAASQLFVLPFRHSHQFSAHAVLTFPNRPSPPPYPVYPPYPGFSV